MIQSSNSDNTNITTNPQHLIAGLYGRVSTGRQEQEATIESQLEETKARIKADGNILTNENIFIDDGWTGEILQRPQLDAMRDAAQAGNFQVLYVYDRGRLSRVFAYQELVIEELTNLDVKFITLHDVKADTPEEKVLQAMQGVFHEYERVKIVERMRRGKLFKARNGIMINGSALYGYDYFRKTDKEPARYLINEEEARVVRMIFEWVGIEGISMREVIKRLYDKGIPPRKGKSDFWTKGPIVRILDNESYISGTVYYNKSEAVVAKKPIKHIKYKKIKRNSRKWRPREDWIPFKVQPIIEDYALYERVQKVLESNKRYARKNRKYDYMLSGLVYCECGNKRAGDGSSKQGHFYYRCAERIYNFPLERKCSSQGVNALILDTMTWKELEKILNDPSLLKEHAEEWLRLQANNDVDTREKNKLIELVCKIEDEEKRYAKAYGAGTLEFEPFRDLIKETKKKKLIYKKQLDELSQQQSQAVINLKLDDLIDEVKRVLKSFDLNNKIAVIKDIIDKVIIQERSGVEVWAHLPLSSIQKLGYEPIGWDCWVAECREVDIV